MTDLRHVFLSCDFCQAGHHSEKCSSRCEDFREESGRVGTTSEFKQDSIMSNFFVALWQSVFQPGTTPQLIIATHLSFASLVATLAWLIYATSGNVHFIVLFCLAICLWIAVTWFIQELENLKMKENKELEVEVKTEGRPSPKASGSSSSEIRSHQSNQTSGKLRSRKV